MRQSWFGKALISGLYLAGCASGSGPGGQEDETPEAARGQAIIGIAPLTFEGATNVCWRVTVTNGPQRTGEIVWQMDSVCADEFGDERGGIAYVGSCDATTGNNSVTIELLDIYTDPNGNSTKVDPSEYQNPCGLVENWTDVETRVLKDGEDPYPLCTRNVVCLENKDTPVAFDVTVVRDANQGFFDIAVRFDEIFCSAKLDTCTVDENGKEKPIELLFDAEGEPGPTVVLALACSAQPGRGVNTVLHMSSITLDCPPPFEDIHLDPSDGAGGNVWRLDGSPGDPNPEDAVFQYAVYEQTEQLECDGESCNKRFWNVAIGLDPARLPSGCYIRATATTTDGGFPDEAGEPTGRFPDRGGYALISYASQITKSGGELACVQDGLNDGGGVSVVFPEPTAKCAPDFCYFQDASGTWNDRAAPKTLDKVLGGVSEWCEGGRVPVREFVSADTLCAGSIGQCCLEVWKEAATKRGLLDSNGCATADPAEWAIRNIPKVPSLAWCNAPTGPTGSGFPLSFGPSDLDFEPTAACESLELNAADLQSELDKSGGFSYCGEDTLEACLPSGERLVLASVETYLKYAEAIGLTGEGASVSNNLQGYFSVETGLKLLEAIGGTASWGWNGSNWVIAEGINPDRLAGVASVETYLKFAEALGMHQNNYGYSPVIQVVASVETYLKFAEAIFFVPSVAYRAIYSSIETYLKYAEAIQNEGELELPDAVVGSVETYLKYEEAIADDRQRDVIASIETYLKYAEATGDSVVGQGFPIASVETYLKYAEAVGGSSEMRTALVSSVETWAKFSEAVGESPCKDPESRWFQAYANFERFILIQEIFDLDSEAYLSLTFDAGAPVNSWEVLRLALGAPGLSLRNNYDASLRPDYAGSQQAGIIGLSSSGALTSWHDYGDDFQSDVLARGLVTCREDGALGTLVGAFGEETTLRILDKGIASGTSLDRIINGYQNADFIDRLLDKGLVASDPLTFEDVLEVVAGFTDDPDRVLQVYDHLVDRGYVAYNASPFEVLELAAQVVEQGNGSPSEGEVLDSVLYDGLVVKALPMRSVFELANSLDSSAYTKSEVLTRFLERGMVADLGVDADSDVLANLAWLGDRGNRNPVFTRVAAASHGQALPVQTLHVVSTEGFSPTGTLSVQIRRYGRIYRERLDYEALTPTSFQIVNRDWWWWWGEPTLEEGFLVNDANDPTPANVVQDILDKGMVTHGPLSLEAIRRYTANTMSESDSGNFIEAMMQVLDKGALVLHGDANFSNLAAFGVGANSGTLVNGALLDKGIVVDGLDSRASDFELFQELQHVFAGMSPEQVRTMLDKGIVVERSDGCIRIRSVETYLKYAEAVGTSASF
jgi:hypothetical protein